MIGNSELSLISSAVSIRNQLNRKEKSAFSRNNICILLSILCYNFVEISAHYLSKYAILKLVESSKGGGFNAKRDHLLDCIYSFSYRRLKLGFDWNIPVGFSGRHFWRHDDDRENCIFLSGCVSYLCCYGRFLRG